VSEETAMPAQQLPPSLKLAALATSLHLPYSTMFELTSFCNLRCVHCYDVDIQRRHPDELSTDQVKRVLDGIAEAGGVQVTFTGGEVFTRTDLVAILEHARARHFQINIATNATLLDAAAAQLFKELGVWEVGVSLYGAKAECHEAVTRVAGSFRRTMRGIEHLLSVGIRIKLKCILMKPNADQYRPLRDLATSLGVKYVIDPMLTPRLDGSTDVLELRLSDDQLRSVIEEKELELGSQYEDLPFRDRSPAEKLNDTMCKAGVAHCAVSYRGILYPCVQLLLPVGDLKREDFGQVWKRSPVLRKLRTTRLRDIRQCRECELIADCFRCPGVAHLEDGDAFGPSSYACRQARVVHEVRIASMGAGKQGDRADEGEATDPGA
jgi:radical SAM protein with 4Fe4S-binding SPASM domain